MTSTGSDNLRRPTYAQAMERGQPFIRLRLGVDQPIELSEFVGAFTALASEYDRYVREAQPGAAPEATLFVKEVRAGSIEADLIPFLTAAGASAMGALGLPAAYNVLDEFVERLGNRLKTYTLPGGRVPDVSKSELADFGNQVAAVASVPGSTLEIAVIEIEDGQKKVRAAFGFNSREAAEIQQRVVEHKLELDHQHRSDRQRVLMVFTRSDIRTSALGKRSGEQVVIGDISPNPKPLIYASDLAEQQIKHEITEAEDNVYKKGFVVDVNVQMRRGKPIAYSVTNLHQVVDLPDDEGED